jgi:hypothetical protein
MTNGIVRIPGGTNTAEILQEVRNKTLYLESRVSNTANCGVANRDMPYSMMKRLIPGQWFAVSCEFSERLFFKTDAGAGIVVEVEWWTED